jgi:hypothetical protein
MRRKAQLTSCDLRRRIRAIDPLLASLVALNGGSSSPRMPPRSTMVVNSSERWG